MGITAAWVGRELHATHRPGSCHGSVLCAPHHSGVTCVHLLHSMVEKRGAHTVFSHRASAGVNRLGSIDFPGIAPIYSSRGSGPGLWFTLVFLPFNLNEKKNPPGQEGFWF